MRKLFFLLTVTLGLLSLGRGSYAEDYLLDNDPASLESSARYNYHLGEYYYTQGQFAAAEQYFERSRDMMARRQAIASGTQAALPEVQPQAKGNGGLEYIIADGDVLYISVWENPDLDQEVVVRPDGRISFPLVGDLSARGRTIVELDDILTEALKEFIRNPEVSISIRKLGGSKVIILGEVQRPGVYAVSGSKTILEAVALAGGFTPDAVANSVVLIRGGFGNPQVQRLDLKKTLMHGRAMNQNVALESEDIVFVPKTFISDLGRVLTQIIDPVSRGSFAAEVMRKW
ncbi:MAG: polysaccharide biosynthesis/export family protein [Deltaproteobacteria bacterium]